MKAKEREGERERRVELGEIEDVGEGDGDTRMSTNTGT